MVSRSLSRSCLQLSTAHSTSAAHSFTNLSPRRFHSGSAPPILDFLLPPATRRWNSRSAISRSKIPLQSRRLLGDTARGFTSSTSRHATVAIHNPQKDDDGKEMSVHITPRASNRLKQIMTKDSNPDFALRIQVESGGCHGFQYLITPVTLPPLSAQSELKQESTPALNTSSSDPNAMPSRSSGNEGIMEEHSPALNTSSSDPNAMPSTDHKSKNKDKVTQIDEEDVVFMSDDGSEAKVVMDKASLDLLNGSKVDFTNELIGSQFKIDNPLATSSCGCGTSFDIK